MAGVVGGAVVAFGHRQAHLNAKSALFRSIVQRGDRARCAARPRYRIVGWSDVEPAVADFSAMLKQQQIAVCFAAAVIKQGHGAISVDGQRQDPVVGGARPAAQTAPMAHRNAAERGIRRRGRAHADRPVAAGGQRQPRRQPIAREFAITLEAEAWIATAFVGARHIRQALIRDGRAVGFF